MNGFCFYIHGIMLGGAASTSVFQDRPNIFGTFPPTSKYMAEAIRGLALAGATSVATIFEDASFTKGVCAAVSEYAAEYNMTLTSETLVVASPTQENLTSVVEQMVEENPDVVITCVYDAGCVEWVNTMRTADWSPKAQVFTVCIGQEILENGVGDDREFMMGVSPWDPSLPIEDTLTGYSAFDFAQLFYSYTARTATYHAASAFASLAVLLQAIRDTNSFDVPTLQSSLSTNTFRTLYGDISFDTNGQSNAPSLVLQYNREGKVQTVFPDDKRSNPLEGIVYPMPTWANRDCVKAKDCENSGGTCEQDGTCSCGTQEISIGRGSTAKCVIVPEEDFSYLNDGLLILGYVAVAAQGLCSVVASVWVFVHRQHELVKASQPVFLHVISFGCFIIVSSIIPMSIEGDYRVKIDPDTFEFTDEKNPSIDAVDSACMGFVWLYNMGFIITFSALFAKIARIKKIFFRKTIQRATITAKQVAIIIVILSLAMFTLNLVFQFVAPMRWEREVIDYDINGFRLTSVGLCELQEHSEIFIAIIAVFHLGCLLYALVLCFQLRSVPAEFVEAKWIFVTIFCFVQVLVTAIPVMFITQENPEAFYFVRMGIVFAEGFIVTSLMFGPKMYSVYTMIEKGQVATALRQYQSRASQNVRSENVGRGSKSSSHYHPSRVDSKVEGENEKSQDPRESSTAS